MSAHRPESPERVTRTGQDLHDPRPDGADLMEAEAEELTIAHVRGGGRVADGWRHGAYVLLGGTLTARHWLERRVRRLCEALARDQGYAAFRDLPQTRRGLTRRLAEVDAAASLMWASGVTQGRLVDRYFDIVTTQRKLAQALGLQRAMKDAKAVTLQEYVGAKYGARNGTS